MEHENGQRLEVNTGIFYVLDNVLISGEILIIVNNRDVAPDPIDLAQ